TLAPGKEELGQFIGHSFDLPLATKSGARPGWIRIYGLLFGEDDFFFSKAPHLGDLFSSQAKSLTDAARATVAEVEAFNTSSEKKIYYVLQATHIGHKELEQIGASFYQGKGQGKDYWTLPLLASHDHKGLIHQLK